MELDSLEQRHLEHGQFDVADDGHVSRVDHVAQRLRRTNAVLSRTHTHTKDEVREFKRREEGCHFTHNFSDS